MKLIDLTGKRFGSLVVIKRHYSASCPKHRVMWLCQCDCGNVKAIEGSKLRGGVAKTCGCRLRTFNFNETREDGDAVYIKVKDREVIVDKEDLPKIFPHRICINSSGYAMYSRNVFIHRLIMGNPKGYMIDHINHNLLDNRKSNLRIVTNSENQMNRVITSNTGEYGITLCSDGYYRITVDDRYCGLRKTLEEAIEVRDKCLKGTKQSRINFYLREKVVAND